MPNINQNLCDLIQSSNDIKYKKYCSKFILKEIYIFISLLYISMMGVTCNSKIKKNEKNKHRIIFLRLQSNMFA